MSDTSDGGGDQGAAASGQAQQARGQLTVRAQYVKDLSFENPNGPQGFGPDKAPKIDISVAVNGKPQGGDNHEVELQINAKAEDDGKTVFLIELTYGGMFSITGVPAEHLQAVVMIECPRLLFPFARRVIADCCRDGGYPPLMLEPIDFSQLFLRHQQQQAQQQGGPAPVPEV